MPKLQVEQRTTHLSWEAEVLNPRRASLLSWMVLSLLAYSHAEAFELDATASHELALALLASEVAIPLLDVSVSRVELQSCSYGGYVVACADIRNSSPSPETISQQLFAAVSATGADEHTQYEIVSPLERNLSEPFVLANSFVAYFPDLAYLGRTGRPGPDDWNGENQQTLLATERDRVFAVSPVSLRSVASEFHFHFTEEEDFPAWVELARVLHGSEILKLWESFVAHSDQIDADICEEVCLLAHRVSTPDPSLTGIAACYGVSVDGILGAPEDCIVSVIQRHGQTFLRAGLSVVLAKGFGDGIGEGALVCESEIEDPTVALHSLREKLVPALNTSEHHDYRASARSSHAFIITNRYALSALVPGKFEVSTIRLEAEYSEACGDDQLRSCTVIKPYVTAGFSDGDQRSDDAYRFPDRSEQRLIDKNLMSLMPDDVTCDYL